MSWDFRLKDLETDETLEVKPHFMYGGNIRVGCVNGELVKLPNTLAELNVTYNYSSYYYEAARKFRQETEGIRDLNNMYSCIAIHYLEKLIKYILDTYKPNGEWLKGKRTKFLYDIKGVGSNLTFDEYMNYIERTGITECVTQKEIEYEVSEGDTDDYWEVTAANALKPLYQLLELSKMRPDGIWEVM